jgi:hypothetical protein
MAANHQNASTHLGKWIKLAVLMLISATANSQSFRRGNPYAQMPGEG